MNSRMRGRGVPAGHPESGGSKKFCPADDTSCMTASTARWYVMLLCWRQAGSVEYIMQPRIDRLSCRTYPIGGSAGPTAQAQRRRLLQANAAHLGLVRALGGQQGPYTLPLAQRVCCRTCGAPAPGCASGGSKGALVVVSIEGLLQDMRRAWVHAWDRQVSCLTILERTAGGADRCRNTRNSQHTAACVSVGS